MNENINFAFAFKNYFLSGSLALPSSATSVTIHQAEKNIIDKIIFVSNKLKQSYTILI